MVQANTFGAAIVGSVAELPKYQCWKSSYFKTINCFQKVLYACGKKKNKQTKTLLKSAPCILLTLTRNVSSRILICRWWGGQWGTDCFLYSLKQSNTCWTVGGLLQARHGSLCCWCKNSNILLCFNENSVRDLTSPLLVLLYFDILSQGHSCNMLL